MPGGEVEAHHPEQRVQKPFGLAQREMVEGAAGSGRCRPAHRPAPPPRATHRRVRNARRARERRRAPNTACLCAAGRAQAHRTRRADAAEYEHTPDGSSSAPPQVVARLGEPVPSVRILFR